MNEYENDGQVPVESNMGVEEYFNFWFENYVKTNLKENTQKTIAEF